MSEGAALVLLVVLTLGIGWAFVRTVLWAADAGDRALDERRSRRRSEQEARQKAEEAARVREAEARSKRIQTHAEIQALSGTEFEQLIADLWTRAGYLVEQRGGSGDEGVDLVLLRGSRREVVQCKRWRGDVGAPVVRDFFGALMHDGAAHGFVVTSGRFTPAAQAFAVGKPITLVSGEALVGWVSGQKSPPWIDDGSTSINVPWRAPKFDPVVLRLMAENLLADVPLAHPASTTAPCAETIVGWCPHCGAKYQAKARFGASLNCPMCRRGFVA